MDACALWRFFIPHLNLRNSRFVFSQGAMPFDMMNECDVIGVQRMMHKDNVKFLAFCKSFGLKIVFDLDDHVWDLPTYNPAYPIYKKHLPVLEECLQYADIFTVSTEALKKYARRHVGHISGVTSKKPIPIEVLENYVDPTMFYNSGIEKDPDKVVIGWGGSNSHSGDLWHVWQLLPKILEDYPNVEMHFVGMLPPKEIEHNPRVHAESWCHVAEFGARFSTWNWDIALAPLEDNDFNKCKSSIKMQEAGALGIPCLASFIDNYRDFVTKQPGLEWLLCSTPYQWDKKLRTLIEDRSRRLALGLLMKDNIEANYDIRKNIWRHQAILEKALSC